MFTFLISCFGYFEFLSYSWWKRTSTWSTLGTRAWRTQFKKQRIYAQCYKQDADQAKRNK